MIVEPLNLKQENYIRNHRLISKYQKQIKLIVTNPNHPSLHTKKLIPASNGLYSFRIDIQYRAIFRCVSDHIKIISITNHYR